FLQFFHANLPWLGDRLRTYLHKAANALPLRHGRGAAARAGHHHPAFLVGVVGLVLLALQWQPDNHRTAGASPVGAELDGAGGDGMHALPGHEPEAAVGAGDADLAALAVEAQRWVERFVPG